MNMVAAPQFQGGPKNFRPKSLGGPEQKTQFGGGAKFKGGSKILGGGAMNPSDVIVIVLKDILLC